MNALDRAEFIEDLAYSANTKKQLSTNGGLIPNDRYMYGIQLQVEGRYSTAASNFPAAVLAGGLLNLIQRVTISGYHKARKKQETIFDLRGVDIFQLNSLYRGVKAALAPASGTPTITTAADNDFRYTLNIPFTPMGCGPQQKALYLLDAPNYNQLKMDLTWADESNIVSWSSTKGAGAFTAYGAATGTPRARVTGLFAQDGARKFAGYIPARCFRYFAEVAPAALTTADATNARLYDLAKGYAIRSLLLKTGVKATGVTAGNDAYASVSNTILSNIKLNVGYNKPVRFYPDMTSLQHETLEAYGLAPDTGYGLIDFAQHGALDMALQTAPLIGGAQGDTDLYLSADTDYAANQALTVIVEELRYRATNPAQRAAAAARR